MKTKLFFISFCNLLICNFLIAQNINTTLGTLGVFTIKDASTNYFTLSQATGQVNILKTLRLENTTDPTIGIIFKGTERFIHNYKPPISLGFNTFIGVNSGNFTMFGSLIEASYNTGIGHSSLTSLTAGSQNTGVGYQSLYSNTSGRFNTAVGTYSLYSNADGNYNTAVGLSSLYSNTGSGNTALGSYSLSANTTGYDNTAVGISSLQANTVGYQNSAFGNYSLYTTGNNNTAIGYDAQVPSGTASNQVRIGNTFVTYAGVQVPWTITSDRRWKSDIQNSGLGLGFISKLRPVSYFRNNDESKKTEYGFIAQEVEEVLKESGAENTGMITIDDKGMYELRYNDLLAPMVKAIQELNEKCAGLESENSQLKSEVESLKDMKVKLAELELSQLELIKMVKSNNSKETQSIKITDNK